MFIHQRVGEFLKHSEMADIKRIFTAVVVGLTMLTEVQADTLADCMTRNMMQSTADVTVGELRQQCLDALSESKLHLKAEDEVVSRRIREDREHVLEPFTLMSHRPNYFLVAAYNSAGYDATDFRQLFNDPALAFDDTEAQFQISIKTPLAIDLFSTLDIYAAYTNRSFWQVYNRNISAPFRETNHEPEIWAQFNPNWKISGMTNTVTAIGVVHQSNGRGGVLSRSWNRVFASFILEKSRFALVFKPWYRIPEDAQDDDNPDITDYLGHYSLLGGYKKGEHVVTVMSRNNIESGFSRGAVEVSWSFPIAGYPYVKAYMQLFSGYGESLIDYNHYANTIGFGIALTDYM